MLSGFTQTPHIVLHGTLLSDCVKIKTSGNPTPSGLQINQLLQHLLAKLEENFLVIFIASDRGVGRGWGLGGGGGGGQAVIQIIFLFLAKNIYCWYSLKETI